MRGIVGGEYRDETRVLHMLQALERIVQETCETSRDRLPMFRKLAEQLPPTPDTPSNIGDFL